MNIKLIENISKWFVFSITLLIYALSASHSINFWDSPEFIATSYKLQVGHPPGAPLYTILSRVFISLFPLKMVPYAANLFSAICGAFSVLFLYQILTLLGKNMLKKYTSESSLISSAFIIVGAAVGAFSFAFSHSFWVSATEAEVYTLQTLIVSAILYLTLKWKETKNPRLILLSVFLLGLSVGVHIMTFAVLFPVVFVYVIDKYKVSLKSVFISVLIAGLGYVLLNSILFKGLIKISSIVELTMVNHFSLPFNSGVILFFVLVMSLLVYGVYYSVQKKKRLVNQLFLGTILYIIGYSTYSVAIIRSADTPISTDCSDVFRLISYLNYEQFVSEGVPVITGKYYNAPLSAEEPLVDGKKEYRKNTTTGKYDFADNGKLNTVNYDENFITLFPRMHHSSPTNVTDYQTWIDVQGTDVKTIVNGKTVILKKPTFFENLKFMFKFQFGWLNYRYLMWNFVGKQNDNKGVGEPLNGNWISGIDMIDNSRIGEVDVISASEKNNKTRNTYYFLPLLLGLLGIYFLFKEYKYYALFAGLLFISFGPLITFYINQIPSEVYIRERDYVLLNSYYAFSLFIGIGTMAIGFIASKNKGITKKALALSLIGLLAPFLMLSSNWDDHNKTVDTFSKELAKAYLDSCEPNAILITDGDNATFPLWYLQEVEGYRTDVRIVNYSLLGLDWYANKLKQKANQSDPILISEKCDQYVKNLDKQLPLDNSVSKNKYLNITQVLNYLNNDQYKLTYKTKKSSAFPTTRLILNTDSLQLKKRGIKPGNYQGEFIADIYWEYAKNNYLTQDVVLLDLINNNIHIRPICFAFTGNYNHTIELDNYLVKKGLIGELMPVKPQKNKPSINLIDVELTYDLLMDKALFNNLSNSEIYIPSENKSIAIEVLRPMFYYLAVELVERGDDKRALQVLERCETLMPNATVPYREYMFDIGKTYYKINETEKARKVIDTIIENIVSDINVYISFVPQYKKVTLKRANRSMDIYEVILKELSKRDPEFLEPKKKSYTELLNRFNEWLLIVEKD